MRIIILGCNNIGHELIKSLQSYHEVTIIDPNNKNLSTINQHFDVETIEGHPFYPNTLQKANADQADAIIAITDNEEGNMIACQIGYSLFDIPYKIAQIKSPHYFTRHELFADSHLPIDLFLSPETIIAKHIQAIIKKPGPHYIQKFNNDKVTLMKFNDLDYQDNSLSSIVEDYNAITVSKNFGQTNSLTSNEISFLADEAASNNIFSQLHNDSNDINHITIFGANKVCIELITVLEEMDVQIKIIDPDEHKCQKLAQKLDQCTILNGDPSDPDFLKQENWPNRSFLKPQS